MDLGHIPFSDKPILRGTSLGVHDVFSAIQSDTVYDQQYDVGYCSPKMVDLPPIYGHHLILKMIIN